MISRLRALRPPRFLAAFFAGAALLTPLLTGMAPAEVWAGPTPLLSDTQMVVYYGKPNSPGMGILGTFDSPAAAATSLQGETALVDSLNGPRKAQGAMDIVYGMVTADPGPGGIYVSYLDDATTRAYIDAATQRNQEVILDLQIGRSTVLDEVKKVAPYLTNPRVHVAIDPEYAVGPAGVPIQDPGRITGDDLNRAQAYLSDLVQQRKLPPKMLIVHQYMDATIADPAAAKTFPNVTLVLNVDGIGAPADKLAMYQHFAGAPWAQRRSYTVFLRQDTQLPTEQQLLAMQPAPDMIMFQ
ncbi:MAG: hypothetical protein IVW36_05015 [Dehalococcoidia bacterium]|nr:hypothetical protein [Dehalococcoidia bacterium]